MREYYELLNIKEGAKIGDIKKASRKLLLKYHPDLHPENKHWAQEKTKKILFAYEFLCNQASDTTITFRSAESFRQAATPQPKIVTIPMMTFELGDFHFAVAVYNIKNVLALEGVKITRIAAKRGLYPFISGIIHHRDTIAPLLDLQMRLDMEGTALNKQQVLLCETDEQPLALIIDRGKDIIQLEPQEYEDQSLMASSQIKNDYLVNVVERNDRLIHILDLEKLLSN